MIDFENLPPEPDPHDRMTRAQADAAIIESLKSIIQTERAQHAKDIDAEEDAYIKDVSALQTRVRLYRLLLIACLTVSLITESFMVKAYIQNARDLQTAQTAAQESAAYVLPSCPEDATLIGVGQFESGQWTSYQCGLPVDNCTP